MSDILGTDDDPSLRLIRVNVHDSEVRIKFLGTDGSHVKRFHDEDAIRVVTELISWSNGRQRVM